MPGKKRTRSFESDFIGQSKYFISNSFGERRDPYKMQQIYDKTLHLLFKGVHRKPTDFIDKKLEFKNVRLNGNGIFTFSGPKPSWVPDIPDRKCKCCSKDARLHADCVNCNLDLCEFCGINCSNCDEPLCTNCITLFDCGSLDQPCCSRCKSFVGCDYFA